MESMLRIKLVKSLIGRLPKHVTISKQLGLRKMHRTVSHKNIPSIRGLVNQINYLLQIEEYTE